MPTPFDLLKLLADPTRLRIFALVRQEELSVGELEEILEMGQSRISSHLSQLRKAGLVIDRREGKHAHYSVPDTLEKPVRDLTESTCHAIENTPESKRDRQSLQRVLDKRRRSTEAYFNLIAGRLGKNYCPGRSWEAIGHLLLRLVPALDVADLGAGEGLISQMIARRAQSVWCIDNSAKMVEVGTQLAEKNGLANLFYKLGDIESVPLPDASVDLALLSQALHHARHPQKAVGEAARILRPGGQLVVLDLLEHSFAKARELYADLWLGFKESQLHEFLRKAGLQHVEVVRVAREEVPPYFETVLASGTKPR